MRWPSRAPRATPAQNSRGTCVPYHPSPPPSAVSAPRAAVCCFRLLPRTARKPAARGSSRTRCADMTQASAGRRLGQAEIKVDIVRSQKPRCGTRGVTGPAEDGHPRARRHAKRAFCRPTAEMVLVEWVRPTSRHPAQRRTAAGGDGATYYENSLRHQHLDVRHGPRVRCSRHHFAVQSGRRAPHVARASLRVGGSARGRHARRPRVPG